MSLSPSSKAALVRSATDPLHLAADVGDGRVAMAWVRTDDGRVHVSRYAASPGEPRPPRPRAWCLACDCEVDLKLGQRRAHHAAHRRGDTCVLSDAESALHFNVKCALAASLEAAIEAEVPLRVEELCLVGRLVSESDPALRERLQAEALPYEASLPSCRTTSPRVWLPRWTRVAIEPRLGDSSRARVPDLVLYDGDHPVGAIEVFNTHAVDVDKVAAMAALGVPWIEVRAYPTLALLGRGWHPGQPLPVHRTSDFEPMRCAEHAARAEAWREQQRYRIAVTAAKIVDICLPDGARERIRYVVETRFRDGQHVSLRLRAGAGFNDPTLLKLDVSDDMTHARRRALADQIDARVKGHVARLSAGRGAIADSPMKWAKGGLAQAMSMAGGRQLDETHPCRFVFDPGTRRWVRADVAIPIDWTRPNSDTLHHPHPQYAAIELERARIRRTVEEAERSDQTTAGAPGGMPSPSFGGHDSLLAQGFDVGSDAALAAAASAASGDVDQLGIALPAPLTADDYRGALRRVLHVPGAWLIELPRHDVWARRSAWIAIPDPGAAREVLLDLDVHLSQISCDHLFLSRADEWPWARRGRLPWCEVRRYGDVLIACCPAFTMPLERVGESMTRAAAPVAPAFRSARWE